MHEKRGATWGTSSKNAVCDSLITIKWCHGRCVFDVLQLQSVFGANRRCVAMGPIFGMWEVWVETTQTHCWERHTKLTPLAPPFRPANTSSRYWFRIQSRELELKTFTPSIQQCFQSCIHTAYILTYYSNIDGSLESLAHDSETSMFRPAKWFQNFLPSKGCEKNRVCSFSPACSRNWLSPWQQRWWTLAHLRGGNRKKMVTNFAVHLLYFFLRKTVMLKYGCYY